ncbi:MAG: SAM-dependent methyltransferase [Lachnospiraceae bacterium]|nr:SAM-dependent methyltransferase [Lachnospiraceae bacterium]
MQLPGDFKESMKSLLCGSYDDFISSYEVPLRGSLRVNTSKISVDEFKWIAPFSIEPIDFIPEGFYIDEADGWTKHPYYHAGLFYIQEASAMLPASLFPLDENDSVLDMCAAPGGKSTAIAGRVRTLISNDISFSRSMALVKNIEHSGCTNCNVTCEDPEKLARLWPERFDKIAVDAPCSGEGMFRKDRSLIEAYAKKKPEDYAPLQLRLLELAYRMLKGGGSIMYSTCTFSDIEDEQVILSFTKAHDDIEVSEIEKIHGLCGPYDKYSDEPSIKGCAHAFPHTMGCGGHFVALMKKSQDRISESPVLRVSGVEYIELPQSVKDFSSHFLAEFCESFKSRRFLANKDGFIYMLPPGFDETYDKSIRYVRTGTCIGKMSKSGGFTPHTALALSMSAEDFDNVLMLGADDPDAIRYLKGETLGRSYSGRGYVMICADRFPLGFAKSDGAKIKNLYEKGWVYR